jgi:hypothetical protein
MIRIEDMFSGIAMDTIRSKVHLTATLCNFQSGFPLKLLHGGSCRGGFRVCRVVSLQ